MLNTSRQKQLAQFLKSAFVPLEFRLFLEEYDEYRDLVPELVLINNQPGEQFFPEAVRLLSKRGLLGATFVERLKSTRPMRTVEIERVLPGTHTPDETRVVIRVDKGIQSQELQRILRSIMELTANVTVEVLGSSEG